MNREYEGGIVLTGLMDPPMYRGYVVVEGQEFSTEWTKDECKAIQDLRDLKENLGLTDWSDDES